MTTISSFPRRALFQSQNGKFPSDLNHLSLFESFSYDHLSSEKNIPWTCPVKNCFTARRRHTDGYGASTLVQHATQHANGIKRRVPRMDEMMEKRHRTKPSRERNQKMMTHRRLVGLLFNRALNPHSIPNSREF